MEIELDCVILGFSVCGVAAALELQREGCSVIVCEHPNPPHRPPDHPIRSFLRIGPTPLNSEPLDGYRWDALASDALAKRRIRTLSVLWQGSPFIDCYTGRIVLTGENFLSPSGESVRIRASCVIFAPNGVEPGLPEPLGADRFFPWGYDKDAMGRASSVRKRHIAVVGCGPRSLEQAEMLGMSAESVTVICAAKSFSAPQWLLDCVTRRRNVRLFIGATVASLLGGERGFLRGLAIEREGASETLDVTTVFSATTLEPDWELWGGSKDRDEVAVRGWLIPSGVAAGAPYWDHAALFADGVRAGRRCAEQLSPM